MEEWRDVNGYTDVYQVSSLGRVRSFKSGKWKLLKSRLSIRGYYLVTLYKDGKSASKWVHRLVAEAFIENPDNLPQVNHKDENKLNNEASNLEWCDFKYNINYGEGAKIRMKKIKSKLSKPVHCIDTDEIYESAIEAERQTGIQHISEVCSGKRESAGGMWWEYLE